MPGAFQTVSEIGAAFAGFAALVSVLALRQGGDRAIDATRLHIAVAGSLIAAVGAFFPTVLSAHVSAPDHVWRYAAGALFALNYGYGVVYLNWGRKLRGDRPAESLPTQVAFFVLEALILLSLVMCLIDIGSGEAFYLSVLVALLGQAAFVYMGIVTKIVEEIAGADDA